MTKAIAKTTNRSNLLAIALPFGESVEQTSARAAIQPAINAAEAINAFKGDADWNKLDFARLFDSLQASIDESKAGDLSGLEAMLIGQATALQAMFSSLAVRAGRQEHLQRYEVFFSLALKAQAQSRATIQTLVDLKFPRQATFVKQANIANGPQQINNAAAADLAHVKTSSAPNKLSGERHELLPDAGAPSPAITGSPKMATMDKVYRATNRRWKGESVTQRDQAQREVGRHDRPTTRNPGLSR